VRKARIPSFSEIYPLSRHSPDESLRRQNPTPEFRQQNGVVKGVKSLMIVPR